MRVTTFKAHQDPQMLFEGVMIIPHWGSNLRGDFSNQEGCSLHTVYVLTLCCVYGNFYLFNGDHIRFH